MNKPIKFLIIVIFFIIFTGAKLIAGIPHAIYGTIQYPDSTRPAVITWNAYLTDYPGEILNNTRPSLYDSLSGSFLIQCAGFSNWTAGDTVHIDFTDGTRASGSVDVVLTFEPADHAGVVNLQKATGIRFDEEELPAEIELYQNYPNPFNPQTIISFRIENPQHITLRVYNAAGQLVKTLVDEMTWYGRHNIVWNGKDENERQVSTGMYLYVLQGEDFKLQQKAILKR